MTLWYDLCGESVHEICPPECHGISPVVKKNGLRNFEQIEDIPVGGLRGVFRGYFIVATTRDLRIVSLARKRKSFCTPRLHDELAQTACWCEQVYVRIRFEF